MALDHEALAALVSARQAEGQRFVFTNGVFDLLHVGHIRYLKEARALGDALIVAVNSDASTKRLKGDSRPIVSQEDRAEVLDAMRSVDIVTIFNEDTPERLVEMLKPAIYVKGGDYRVEDLPEARIVQGYGGRVHVLCFVKGRSTTYLLQRIVEKDGTAD